MLAGSLRRRLVAGMALLAGLFLLMALIAIASLRSFRDTVAGELEAVGEGAVLASSLMSGASAQLRTAEAYLVSPSPELSREFFRVGDNLHTVRRQFRQIAGLGPGDQTVLNRLASEQARLEVSYATAHALRDLGRTEEAVAEAARARAVVDSLVSNVQSLNRRQQTGLHARTTTVSEQARQREVVLWMLFGLAIAMGASVAVLMVRAIEAPLQELIAAARRFGEGDLRPIRVASMPVELDALAQAMGAMGGRLRTVIDATVREARSISASAGDLSAMSEELAASSHEIVKAIAQVTAGAEQQVREVREGDALLGKLRDATAQDLTATERVAALGEATRTLASRHGTDLSTAGEAVAALRDDIRLATGHTRALVRQVEAVGRVIDAAQQIASQSEVLALNAAVEAARGGSAGGGGFGAVADQTRRLTEQSRSAATQVSEVLQGFDTRLQEVLGNLQSAAVRVAEADATTRRSALALEEIGRLVDAMRDIAVRVARSAEDSRRVSTRSSELRTHLEHIAQENVMAGEAVTAAATEQSEATDDIATSAARLLEASERLTALVAGFRT